MSLLNGTILKHVLHYTLNKKLYIFFFFLIAEGGNRVSITASKQTRH